MIHARSLAEAKAAYRSTLQELAPESLETDPATLTELFNGSAARDQLLSAMSGFFAVLALLLSGIGIYGLIAWNVSQRTTEIGVRIALGATQGGVFAMVIRQLTFLLVKGLAADAVASYFAVRAIQTFLYEIETMDPRVFAFAAGVLVVIGLVTAAIPARRAMHIEPAQALRSE